MIAAAPRVSGDANAQADLSGAGAGEPTEHDSRKEGQAPATVDNVDYELLLGTYLSSGKSRQFLANLEARIRRGDFQEATGFLLETLETGTIAALIMDQVKSPRLLTFLQNLEKPQPDAAAGAPLPEASAADTRHKDMERALESETNRANAALRELDALRAELAARDAKDASRTTELQDSAQRTEERIAAATRDRDALMEELAAARAKDAEREALQREVRQEKERADAAAKDRDALREQLAAFRDGAPGGAPSEAELTASVRHEKARADAASAALGAIEAKLAEAQDSLERERKQAEQVRGELDGLRAGLRHDAEQAGRLGEALAREKARAEAAAQELGGLRAEVMALRQSESKLAQVSADLEGERRRAEAAAAEAAALRSEQAKLLSKSAELELAVTREKQRADAAIREFAAGAQEAAAPSWPAASQDPASEAPRPSTQSASAPVAAKSDPVAPLVDRAEALLRRADVVGARMLLERAVQAGSGRAMFLLAQSYDPRMLAQWRIAGGVTGDEAKARDLYAAAQAAGFPDAAEKIGGTRDRAAPPLDLDTVRSGRIAAPPKPRPKEPSGVPSGRPGGGFDAPRS